jgi:hypothetical protein
MGGENSLTRIIGQWKLDEELKLIKCIEKATLIQILYPLVEVKFKIRDGDNSKRLKMTDTKITIYSESVKL